MGGRTHLKLNARSIKDKFTNGDLMRVGRSRRTVKKKIQQVTRGIYRLTVQNSQNNQRAIVGILLLVLLDKLYRRQISGTGPCHTKQLLGERGERAVTVVRSADTKAHPRRREEATLGGLVRTEEQRHVGSQRIAR
jgi:hypothetical protein